MTLSKICNHIRKVAPNDTDNVLANMKMVSLFHAVVRKSLFHLLAWNNRADPISK